MLDEPIDDIIREAADSYQAPFDEKAWAAMRQKLDVHLPQKNRKGRFLLLLLLFVIGGTAAYVLLKPGRGNKDTANAELITAANDFQVDKTNTPTNDLSTSSPNNTTNNPESLVDEVIAVDVQPSNNPVAATPAKDVVNERVAYNAPRPVVKVKKQYRQGRRQATIQPALAEETVVETPTAPQNEDLTVAPIGPNNTSGALEVTDVSGPNQLSAEPVKPATDQNIDKKQPVLTKAITASDTAAVTKVTPAKPKDKKGLGSNLLVLVSAGADMSYIRLSNQGKTTLLYGAGLGYTIGKRWMVRAGVYSVEKIYAASKTDYSLPPQAANNPYLYQIDGRCRVLEIPVGVAYYFAGQKHHRWFAGAGLASMLMKTEQYDYQYKSATGVNYTRSYGVSNESKHYLAILSLSAGYQYQVGKRFSLLAEPYLQLPLNGVGVGKVKLQSTGLLVTAAFRPFGKR